MTLSDRAGLIITIVVLTVVVCATFYIFLLSPQVRFRNCPEQSEQVEVVGKRIKKSKTGVRRFGGSKLVYSYIVAFKFPDGSVKELGVGSTSKALTDKTEVSNSAGDALHEGDTGVITYKEIEVSKQRRLENEDLRVGDRLFLSFEKDL